MTNYYITAEGQVFRPSPIESTQGYTPVVVIDPEDEATVRRLAHAYGCHHERRTWNMQAALRSLLEPPKPPKPDEPTGLGAVVVDGDGMEWVRIDHSQHPWRLTTSGGHEFKWSDVDAAIVLSDGLPDAERLADWERDLLGSDDGED